AFGKAPAVGDSLELRFANWFGEPLDHLTITLFEDDLPKQEPFAESAAGFVSCAQVRWEYLSEVGWTDLDVVDDGTLNFSRSGDLVFRGPHGEPDLQDLPATPQGKRVQAYVDAVNHNSDQSFAEFVNNNLSATALNSLSQDELLTMYHKLYADLGGIEGE